MEVAAHELKHRFAEYLRRVQEGEEIVVTQRGREVARLMPPAPPDERGAIERLRALPCVRPGRGGKVRGARDPIRVAPGTKSLAEIVEEDRG